MDKTQRAVDVHQRVYGELEDAARELTDLTARVKSSRAAYDGACRAVWDDGYAAALRDVSRVFVERPMTFGVDAYCDAKAIKVIDNFAASLGIDLDDAP